MKKKYPFLFLMFLISCLPVWGLEQSIILGREDMWQDVVAGDYVRFTPGYEGYLDVILEEGIYEPDMNTDLLIHFDRGSITNQTPFYSLENIDTTLVSHEWMMGGSSGYFNGSSALKLQPRQEAFFSPETESGSFTMEFWLYPGFLENGETIFQWTGKRREGSRIIHQEVRCSIQDRKVQWKFVNFFVPPDGSEYTLIVEGSTRIVPKKWHHHLLRYDEDYGLVEYFLDDNPEVVTHTTASGREEPTFYLPSAGDLNNNPLIIGEGLTAYLDEFRITRDAERDPQLKKYPLRTGYIITRGIDLEYSNSSLVQISVVDDQPANTALFYYYHLSDLPVIDNPEIIEWIPLEPDTPLMGEYGRYLRFRIELLPDGGGMISPQLSQLQIRYMPDLPPLPPEQLMAEVGNGEITLMWDDVPESDLAGYEIYYGTEPGVYFGTDSSAGDSPLQVGKVNEFTLEGLENGKIYYFAVLSYDSSNPPHRSEFSMEVSARPSRFRTRDE